MNPSSLVDHFTQLVDRPELLVWSSLFAIGVTLLISGLQRVGRRPDLSRATRSVGRQRSVRTCDAEGCRTDDWSRDRQVSSLRRHPDNWYLVRSRACCGHSWRTLAGPQRCGSSALPRVSSDAGALERDLRLVGRGRSIRAFFAEKVVAALAFAVIPPVLASVGGPVTPAVAWLLAGCVGFFVPNWDLARQLATRRTRIRMELPAVLDQLAIATSAGLSLEQAIADIARSVTALLETNSGALSSSSNTGDGRVCRRPWATSTDATTFPSSPC